MPLSHDHIRTTVETYLARHPHEREQLGGLLDALDRPTDIASRSTFTGHVTCGAIVVDPLGRVLHVLHLASGKVLAPGGHTEPADESLAAAALRELHEETGIPPQAVTPWPGYEAVPFDIDIHDIDAHPGKGEPGHQHFDLRFLFRLHTATDVPVVLQEEEVGGIEWRPVDKVTSPSLREKLLKLPPKTEPDTANASALIYNDRGEYLLHLRDYFPGRIWEPGMWSLLGGGREPQDATLEHTVRRELAEEAGLDIADLTPFGTEYASDDAGATVPIAIYAGRWNGDPRELHLTEGVMLAWFVPDDLHRLRIADTTSDLVRRHAASRPAGTAPQSGLSSRGVPVYLPARHGPQRHRRPPLPGAARRDGAARAAPPRLRVRAVHLARPGRPLRAGERHHLPDQGGTGGSRPAHRATGRRTRPRRPPHRPRRGPAPHGPVLPRPHLERRAGTARAGQVHPVEVLGPGRAPRRSRPLHPGGHRGHPRRPPLLRNGMGMSTAASTHPDLLPEEVRQLAKQAVGRIATWTDASWGRASSRVWRADGVQEGVWYVKIHQNTRFHQREVDAYCSWVPSLGTATPTLVTADSALRAVVITAVPGRPLHGIAHPPEQQQLLFHQIGALAAVIHRSAALI